MRTYLTSLALFALLVPAVASAETIHKLDGTTVVGAVVCEVDHTVMVLSFTGKDLTQVPRSQIQRIAENPPAPKGLHKRLAKTRKAVFKKYWRAAKAIVKKHGRAKTADERAAIAKGLDRFGPRILIKPLETALKSSKAASQELALTRLGSMKIEEAVSPLIRAAITSKTKALRPRAHAAAIAVDRGRARRIYEAIAAHPTVPSRRVAAINYLSQMGDRDAVPGLIYVLEKVEMEIQATLAQAGSLRRVPVNLGTTGNAAGGATSVPIELPEQQMIKVATKISVPTLRAIAGVAGKALGKIAGEEHGVDRKAWKNWWNRQPESSGKKLDD